MTEEPLWIDREELHLLYARQVELFGGSFGVRDENLVESALHRPRMKFTYEPHADLFDLAAAYLVGFTKNHGFVDGDKRIGLAAALSFLGANGWRVAADPRELLALVLSVAASEVDEKTAGSWFRLHARPVTPRG
ncbi:MAG TPA: type II toxin-antitoxin system death-on-curing family toxin [Longimicrobium sp.]|nr:type II toxin-antitoxin system death-on-curing family toxin [Longimicrobium sp.]